MVRIPKPTSASAIAAGLGIAAIGFAGRYLLRNAGKARAAGQTIKQQLEATGAFSKYYRGGFDAKMNRREASLILGVSPSASKLKVKEAYRRILLLNHPDRGGSPYLAAKINEAKDFLDGQTR